LSFFGAPVGLIRYNFGALIQRVFNKAIDTMISLTGSFAVNKNYPAAVSKDTAAFSFNFQINITSTP